MGVGKEGGGRRGRGKKAIISQRRWREVDPVTRINNNEFQNAAKAK